MPQVIAPLYCHTLNGTLSCDDDRTKGNAALFGGIFVGAGLLSAAVVGVAMEYLQNYRIFLKSGFVGAAATLLLLLLSMRLRVMYA